MKTVSVRIPFFILCLLLLQISDLVFSDDTPPAIFGKSAITIDVDTHEIIFAKDIDCIRFPASTTKLVTALLLAENRKKSDILVYSAAAAKEYPYVLNLPVGTRLTAEQAMDALLLFSGNDIADMIAENLSGSIESFSILMNAYAGRLGLVNTHFLNPTGLHEPRHFTTAYELSVIFRKICDYPWILESSGKTTSVLEIYPNIRLELLNRNKIVQKNGCIAGKTGWTPESGRCLTALFNRNGRRIAGVVMDSLYPKEDSVVFDDMEKIIDYSYQASKKVLIHKGFLGKSLAVDFKLFFFFGSDVKTSIRLLTKDELSGYPFGSPLSVRMAFSNLDAWKFDKNKSIGELLVSEHETVHKVGIYPDISTIDMIGNNISSYVVFGFFLFILLAFIFSIIYLVRKFKKK